jgi:DNA-binding IclR family transcriptional regulator
MCKLAGRDKATTYRYLQALEEAGFVEQNAVTKLYRLGPALLHLAHLREQTVPRKSGAETPLVALGDATGETVHVSVLSGTTVFSLMSKESPHHSTRAIIDVQTFPLHATASGHCALAFGPKVLFHEAAKNMQTFTAQTVSTPQELEHVVATVRKTGFGRSNRTYDDDVLSTSAPIYDQTGQYAGAVSVACVATRFTPELEMILKENLGIASRAITRNWGGTIPAQIDSIWADTLSPTNTLETAS